MLRARVVILETSLVRAEAECGSVREIFSLVEVAWLVEDGR